MGMHFSGAKEWKEKFEMLDKTRRIYFCSKMI
jgi:hypothetical protein